MTRFWITLSQGVEFVISCIRLMKGGEVFIPKMPSMRITDLAKALAPGCKINIIGIRPGEKLHETLVPVDDAFFTVEKEDRFITCPKVVFSKKNKHTGKLLKEDFAGYRSDNNTRWLTIKELRKMAEAE